MASKGTPNTSKVFKNQVLKEDKDGMTAARQEELSAQRLARAQKPGEGGADDDYMKKWKQAVIDRFNEYGKTAEAKYLTDHDWLNQPVSDKDAFSDVWGGKVYKGGTVTDTDKLYHQYLWGTSAHSPSNDYLAGVLGAHKKKGEPSLLDDTSFQPITTVQRVQMWSNEKKSPNPETDNYAVSSKKNQLIKVTYPDGSTHWMPTDDTNSHASFTGGASDDVGEVSSHAMYGFNRADLQSVGTLSKATPGYLTNDEWDDIGKNNLRNPDGTVPNNRAQYTQAKYGGPLLLYGWWSVMHGADFKNVGYANPACLHSAGGFVNQGSNTTFVSPGCFPLARYGDGTSDALNVANGAGDFLVGGMPTSTPHALDPNDPWGDKKVPTATPPAAPAAAEPAK